MRENTIDEKIKIPIASEKFIVRKDIEIPIRIRSTRLTIVQAPIGYGKTMLLSKSFLETKDDIAWLTLDELDNDPIRFWTYIITSIARSDETIDKEKLVSFIKTSPPHKMVVDLLLNELSNKRGRTAVILDDYHRITNPLIHNLMNHFIDYLPHHVKLFITSRNEVPLSLSKWRIKGWIQEIDAKQLQFQLYEVKEFYERNSPDSHHSMFFYQQILRITEGWPLGVHLISLTRQQEDQHWQAKDSSVMSPVVSSYLIHGILSSLAPPLQDFLIRTSVLEELTPSNCNQILSRSDSEEILKDIEKRGLFIIRLQDSHLAYRYQQLFSLALQQEMQQRFTKDAIMEIYMKAACILYEQKDYPAAIELAFKGKLFNLADQWIEESLVNIFITKQTDMFMRWVLLLRKNSIQVHVETLVLYAFTLIMQYDMERAAIIVRELDRRNDKTNWKNDVNLYDAALIFEIVKVYMLFTQRESKEKKVRHVQKKIHNDLISAESRWKQVTIVYNHFEHQLLRTSLGNRGKLYSIEQLAAFNEILRNDNFMTNNIAGYNDGIQAEVFYEMNLLLESERHIVKAMEYASKHNDYGLSVPMYIAQVKIYLANEQFIKAQALLNYAIGSVSNTNWHCILITMKALGYIREGALEKAEMELNKLPNPTYQHAESHLEFWMLVQARVYMEKGNTRKALYYIDQVVKKAQSESQVTTVIEAKILRSLCMWQISKKREAVDILHEALELAVKSDYKRLFLDEKDLKPILVSYIKNRMNFEQEQWKNVPISYAQSLRTDHIVRPIHSHEKNKPKLTPREEELIRALATGSSNKEIAEQLFLSEGTVRVYLSKVYKKLNVSSRTQAILQTKDWR